MFKLDGLRPLTLADFNELSRELPRFQSDSCELSATNLCMWNPVYDTQMLVTPEFRVFVSATEKFLWYPYPVASARLLADISDAFQERGLADGTIYCMPESLLEADDFGRFFDVERLEEDFDYLYDNRAQVELSGHKLRKKRNLVKQFESEFPDRRIIRIAPENTGRALDEAKFLNSQLSRAEFIDEENEVMDFAFRHWSELGLDGIMLEHKPGRLCGFSVWSLLHGDLADIHFEKAAHGVKGASQFLTRAAAETLLTAGVARMNREQDMGNLGIRQAKHSLDPVRIFRNVRLHRNRG